MHLRLLIYFAIFTFQADTLPARAQNSVLNVNVVRSCPSHTAWRAPRPRCTDSAIFFVHGLFGTEDTWRNERTGNLFPQLVRTDPDLEAYDIYSVVYTTTRIGHSPDVRTIAEELFRTMLPFYRRYEQIVFIAHSLGGNLVRNHVVELKSRFGHNALNRIRLLILLGTPIEGAYLGRAGTFVLPNPQIRTLVTLNSNDYLGLLNSTFLKASQKHEQGGCPSMRIFSAFERRKTYSQLIVEEQSATKGAFACKGFDADHLELAKPANANSPIYRSVKRLLVDCLTDNPGVCPMPRSKCDFLGGLFDEVEVSSTPCNRSWPE